MKQQRHGLLRQFRVAERIEQPRDGQRAFLFGQHVRLQAQLVLPIPVAVVLVDLHDHVVQQADPAAAHVVDAVRTLCHQHQRPRPAAVEQGFADFVRKHRLAEIFPHGDIQPGQIDRFVQRFLLQREKQADVLPARQRRRRRPVRLRLALFQRRHLFRQSRAGAGQRRAPAQHFIRFGPLQEFAQLGRRPDAGAFRQESLAPRRQSRQPRQVVGPLHLAPAVLEELAPLAAKMHVPTCLVRRRAQDADQVLAQEALQVRAQIADQEFGRRRVRTQPHAAGVQIHADVIEPFLPDHGLQFQGIQQDLHAVRQLQRLAAFQIDQPQYAAGRPRPAAP